MADGINFNMKDYLIHNEKYLSDTESGTHETDGELSDEEVSVFYNNSHLQLGSETSDESISLDEFYNWYESNESAITSFLEESGLDYDDEETKQAVYQGLVEFTTEHQTELQKESDENKVTSDDKDDTKSKDKSDSVDVSKVKIEGYYPESVKGNKMLEGFYDNFAKGDFVESDFDALFSYVENNPFSAFSALQILNNAYKKGTSRDDLWTEYSDKIKDTYTKFLKNIDNDTTVSELSNAKKVMDNMGFTIQDLSSEAIDSIMNVYNKNVAGDVENKNNLAKLNDKFYSLDEIGEYIQQNYSSSEETEKLQDLISAIGINNVDNISDEDKETFDKEIKEKEYKGNSKSMSEILSNKDYSNTERMYILKQLFQSEEDIIKAFRDMSSADEEMYLNTLLSAFSGIDLGKEEEEESKKS